MTKQLSVSIKLTYATVFSAALVCVLTPIGLLGATPQSGSPVPQIVGPAEPMAVTPGGPDFTLHVYGANFVAGAVVNWNNKPRATTFVSAHELQAQILATDIASNTAGYISVTNPAPGGGNSSASWAQVEVHAPNSTILVNPLVIYPIGAWALSAADFTHDGILDLMGDYGTYLGFDQGKGDGTFHPVSTAGRNYLPTTPFAYGDFNGDGNLDVALDNGGISDNQVTHMTVWLGDGKGKFSAGPTITAKGSLGGVVTGDFNRDGKLDLITTGQSTVSEFMGNGDGSFQHVANFPYNSVADKILVGDFNGDGKLDLVLFSFQPFGSSLALWFLEGNGDGTFKPLRQVASLSGTRECSSLAQLGDFNGDGKLDVAFCNKSEIGVLLGNGDGTFQPPVYYTADSTGQGLFTFAIGDINSDGKADLLVSEYPFVINYMFAVLLGNGDGTFQAQQTISSITTFGELGITVGDFNSDGLLDFVFQTGGGMFVFIQQ